MLWRVFFLPPLYKPIFAISRGRKGLLARGMDRSYGFVCAHPFGAFAFSELCYFCLLRVSPFPSAYVRLQVCAPIFPWYLHSVPVCLRIPARERPFPENTLYPLPTHFLCWRLSLETSYSTQASPSNQNFGFPASFPLAPLSLCKASNDQILGDWPWTWGDIDWRHELRKLLILLINNLITFLFSLLVFASVFFFVCLPVFLSLLVLQV